MTTNGRDYSIRVNSQFEGKERQVVLDQIRTVDKIRLVKRLGKINGSTQKEVLIALMEMFAE